MFIWRSASSLFCPVLLKMGIGVLVCDTVRCSQEGGHNVKQALRMSMVGYIIIRPESHSHQTLIVFNINKSRFINLLRGLYYHW